MYSEPGQKSNIGGALKKWLQLLTIFAKNSILNLWEGSECVSGFKYVRVAKILSFKYV